ncbi:hypothetical protein VTJ83DRAFT_1304 [Remersonia thermophila]|uniref:C2H2-type domain-containing protein n=1 Tax=Remersonia thermophila TaxID=72144 RepID=A0ABR4DNN0_9PEZI
MERSATEYQQSDPASAAAQYAAQPETRATSYSNSATPTSEYGVYPPTSRSSTFPDMQRPYHPASTPNGANGGMPQTPTNPSIAAASPTYTTHSQYPPYAPPPPDMSQGYQHPGTPSLYTQPRPDWTGYGQQTGHLTPGTHIFHQAPSHAPPPTTGRPHQVYSFVPIPGAQQHKRPRRRYEEIERMYKCGYNGCEKAYGTLNHLNAHVTMQGHGSKRTPDEFKEIRREWKARKKEEEARKAAAAEEERQRQAAAAAAAAQNGGNDPQTTADATQTPTSYPATTTVQLPPIGYQTTRYAPPPPGSLQPQIPEYNYPNYTPTSPYAQSSQQIHAPYSTAQPPSH